MLSKDTVLIVDSSTSARTSIINVLRDHLYCKDIHEASNGQEALRKLKQYPEIDWVFCDWEMPVMTGLELLEEVRRTPETAHLPFIMVTAKSDRDSLVTAVQSGVNSYIIKPFTAKKLVEKVFMTQGRMERRNAERTKVTQEHQLTLNLGNSSVEAELIDISLSGILMLVAHEPLRQANVFDVFSANLKLAQQSNGLEVKCQIIRLEADPLHPARTDSIRVAARFQPMDEAARNQLVSLIETLARQARSAAKD